MGQVYSDYEYRKRTAALKRRARMHDEPCVICHRPIDYTLPSHDRWGFTAEHAEPLSLGGDLYGPIYPAHRQPGLQQLQGQRHQG